MTRMTLCSWLAVAGFALGCADDSPNGPAGPGPGFPMPNFSLIGTTSTVNDGAGDQNDPHISGALVSYTSGNADGTIRIRHHNLATGVDAEVPNSGGDDFLSDISGSKIVFTRANVTSAIYLFDIAAGGSPVEVDPSASANRHNPAIGGSTVAWVDFAFNALNVKSEIVVHELGGSTTRLTNDELLDRTPAVSPDGNVVVWAKCQTTGTGCDIWKAERSAGVWTASVITGSEGEEGPPDTDGSLVVYVRAGEADVFWKPLAGGVENRLSLAGEQRRPAISGSLIAFEHLAVGNWDILVLDIATNTLFTVANSNSDETLTDIWVGADGVGRVVFTRSEADQNIYAVSFQLSVGANEQLSNLIDVIASMNLHAGLANSLTTKLDVAQAKLTADNVTAACNMLQAFMNEVNAQRGGKLTSSQADQLLAAAQQLRATLGCS